MGRYIRKHGAWRRYTPRDKEIPNLKGKRFGKLTAIEPEVEPLGRVVWLCECECRTRQKVRQTHLLKGKREMCGNCRMTGEKSFAWKGCGKLSGTRWKHIKNCVVRKSRTLDFDITIEYAWKLYESQNGKCALSGLDIPFPHKVTDSYGVPSLDRIDSSQGYIKGNVQWVHQDVNKMKWDLSERRFFELCHLISQQNGG